MEHDVPDLIALSKAEQRLLADALDAHIYELADPVYRNSGYVTDPGSDNPKTAAEIAEAEALLERLERLGGAELWDSDAVQFPRLLAEVCAAGLSEQQLQEIATSMDLPRADVESLFERAEAVFEALKQQQLADGALPAPAPADVPDPLPVRLDRTAVLQAVHDAEALATGRGEPLALALALWDGVREVRGASSLARASTAAIEARRDLVAYFNRGGSLALGGRPCDERAAVYAANVEAYRAVCEALGLGRERVRKARLEAGAPASPDASAGQPDAADGSGAPRT